MTSRYPNHCCFLSIISLVAYFSQIWMIKTGVYMQNNEMENVVCEIATISHRPIVLTHWGRMTHICVIKLTIIGSDNGLSPGRRQAIIWTNVGILLIGTLETNFSEIVIEILPFSFKEMRLKVWSAKWRPFCLGLKVLRYCRPYDAYTCI